MRDTLNIGQRAAAAAAADGRSSAVCLRALSIKHVAAAAVVAVGCYACVRYLASVVFIRRIPFTHCDMQRIFCANTDQTQY